VALAFLALFAAGCGDDEDGPQPSSEPQQRDQAGARDRSDASKVSVEPIGCPADLNNCRSASGRIVYVERIDPDGDGDAHFVLASRQSITLPGITVIDVRKDLRPHPLPGVGDEISAAGPVFPGSYGQRQIHAIELRVGR
jgi:hypothetical protein